MEQSKHTALEIAAFSFGQSVLDWETTDVNFTQAFTLGAEWQKEQYKPFIDLYNAIDSCIELTPELLMKCKLLIELNKI